MQFLAETAFFRCRFGDFWGESSLGATRSDWTLRGGFLMIFLCSFYPKSVIRACGISDF